MGWKTSVIVSFLCCLLWLQQQSWAQDLRRIHYGTTNSTSHLPVWVAKDAGYFAKNGLNVEPVTSVANLANRRAIPKEFIGRPLFHDNAASNIALASRS